MNCLFLQTIEHLSTSSSGPLGFYNSALYLLFNKQEPETIKWKRTFFDWNSAYFHSLCSAGGALVLLGKSNLIRID